MFQSDTDARVASLRRNIDFLQRQHGETLRKLHGEIEHLKRENKELQFRLIMEPPKSSRIKSSRKIQRHQTENHKDRRDYLEQSLEDNLHPQATNLSSSSSAVPIAGTEGPSEAPAAFITSLQPLMIQCRESHPPRPPTLRECEVIIRQLYDANSLQSQEILRVKALLRDIVFSKKFTAENYILAKAYLTGGKRTEDFETFPQLGLQTLPRGLPVSQTSKAEKVILPALTHSLNNNNIAERRRRTQAVQRRRLQKTIH